MPDGYVLRMNRDERKSRQPAEPPRIIEVEGIRAIAPRDGDSGGTWVGVNDRGLGVALANLYPRRPPPSPDHPVSRGLLVLRSLRCASQDQVHELVRDEDLTRYPPFNLISVAPGEEPRGLVWDGRALVETVHRSPGLLATSSSRDQDGAERIRRALFESAAQAEGGFTDTLLDELHRSREPEPGPYAVSMERSDASTVSMSTVRTSSSEVTFVYTPGPPHETAADPPLTLQRAARPGARPEATSYSDLP